MSAATPRKRPIEDPLPAALRLWIADIPERTKCPPDSPAQLAETERRTRAARKVLEAARLGYLDAAEREGRT